ncbi:unnamed protein product [Linum trigynum]|uniref:Uncharacterized protein n=1 Tax=Linum trigynum TaxID=586398 RepID=A0AAV2E3R0_9ROSI
MKPRNPDPMKPRHRRVEIRSAATIWKGYDGLEGVGDLEGVRAFILLLLLGDLEGFRPRSATYIFPNLHRLMEAVTPSSSRLFNTNAVRRVSESGKGLLIVLLFSQRMQKGLPPVLSI